MKKHSHFVLIALVAIVFLSFGCTGPQPKPTAESKPPVVIIPEKPGRHTSIYPDGIEYEGILDIAILIQGDWGDEIWRNMAYMPRMIELYYRNPDPDGVPQYACINGMQQGIIGFSYMIGDELHVFRFEPSEGAFIEFKPSRDAYRAYIDDYAKAVGEYRSKGT